MCIRDSLRTPPHPSAPSPHPSAAGRRAPVERLPLRQRRRGPPRGHDGLPALRRVHRGTEYGCRTTPTQGARSVHCAPRDFASHRCSARGGNLNSWGVLSLAAAAAAAAPAATL
eukprot:1729410-Prymnesium_polylepis.2